MRCIWCRKQTSAEPAEHIIPDSLGCPDDLVLRNGEVCGKCNGKNAALDQAIIAEFDVARIVAGVPNKKGRPPQIAHRPNAEGGYRDGQPFINVNMDRAKLVGGNNRNLKPFANRPNDLEMSAEAISRTEGKFTIDQNGLCNTKQCVRALHKIALEVFAQKFGVEEALSSRYDAVRDFVIRGKAERVALLAPASDRFEYKNFAATSDGTVFPIDVVVFQLVVIGFTVDLSPSQESLSALKQKHSEILGTNWTWTPIPI